MSLPPDDGSIGYRTGRLKRRSSIVEVFHRSGAFHGARIVHTRLWNDTTGFLDLRTYEIDDLIEALRRARAMCPAEPHTDFIDPFDDTPPALTDADFDAILDHALGAPNAD